MVTRAEILRMAEETVARARMLPEARVISAGDLTFVRVYWGTGNVCKVEFPVIDQEHAERIVAAINDGTATAIMKAMKRKGIKHGRG